MSIFWHLEHELMILRLAQLEEKIAAQREKLKQMSAYGPQARTAMRILEVREQSLQRSKAYTLFIRHPCAQPLVKIGGVKAELSHAILNFGNAHK